MALATEAMKSAIFWVGFTLLAPTGPESLGNYRYHARPRFEGDSEALAAAGDMVAAGPGGGYYTVGSPLRVTSERQLYR